MSSSILSRLSLDGLPTLEQIRAEKTRRNTDRQLQRVREHTDEVRKKCETLRGFMEEAWPVLEPETKFVPGWHLDAKCEHLEAIHRGQITRLQINEPPGMMKSLTVSVLFQAWEWGPGKRPGLRYFTTSYSEGYARRDSRKTRDLILSDWYRMLCPEIVLVRDNEVDFENVQKGTRTAVPFARLTSGRGNRLIIDDPLSSEQAESDVEREGATRRFRESATSRLNDPEHDAIVLMMHRLHPDDPCGVIDELGFPYVKLVLPMEYVRSLAVKTPFFEDPRKVDGELLCPNRISREKVEELKIETGEHGWATQYQQQPRSRDGMQFFSPADLLNEGQPIEFPTGCDAVFAVVDSAVKTGKKNDGTGVTYFAYTKYPTQSMAVLDWDVQQIQGNLLEVWLPSVFDRLAYLANETGARMGVAGVHIEDKASGSILLQQAQGKNLPAYPIASGLSAIGKSERAVNVSGYVRRGQVKFTRPAYDKTTMYKGHARNHLLWQVTNFRFGVNEQEDDLFDTFCYGIALGLGNEEGF